MTAGSFLDRVRESKLAEVEASHASGEASRWAALPARAGGAFEASLRAAPGVAVIAEIKRSSPSAGDILAGLDAVTQARRYADGGAAAISVLTEERWFGGSLADLSAVSAAVACPTLRKDFILDASQIDAALACGAAAVLLIAAFVPPETLEALHSYALGRGLDVLLEVHDAAEAEVAAGIGASILGVNARNLRTLEVDRGAVLRLGPRLQELTQPREGVIFVAESGIQTPAHAQAAWGAGYRAVLVGESLVRDADPTAAVRRLSQAPWACSEDQGTSPRL